MRKFILKRIYEAPDTIDGKRILVDRLWPRGISKEKAQLYEWMREISPSDELRKKFHHQAPLWPEFKVQYFRQLDDQPDLVNRLLDEAEDGPVTLLYAARDEQMNNAVALLEYLESR